MTTDSRTRADMCPGVWRPWQADDGLLVRIRLMGGLLPTAALQRLSEVSQHYGDGRVYLTRRANLQLRGLPGDGPQLTSAAVTALESTGLIPTRSHELVRNVLASPQTGLAGGRADLRPVINRLDTLLCGNPRLGRLPGRFLFTLDDGRGDLLDRLTGAGRRGTDLGCVALGDDVAQLCVGGRWADVAPLGEVADRFAALASQFVDARGTGARCAVAHPRTRSATGVAGRRGPPDPSSGPTVAVWPGARRHPRAGRRRCPDSGTRSVADRTGLATHVVVTPWRGVLVPNTAEASE